MKAILHMLGQFYERILAILVFILMVTLLAWLGIRVLHLEKDLQVQAGGESTSKKVGSLDITPITNNMARLETPSLWSTNDLSTNVNPRVFISLKMKLLPGKEIPEIITTQGDVGLTPEGLPVNWLHKYGFSVSEPVADYDTDGDGFTNKEEYEARTDPTDPKSHPDFATKLRLVKILPAILPFFFDGVQVINEGKSFSIRRLDQTKSYIVKEGETIPDQQFPGYKIIKYEEKSVEKPSPTIKEGGKPVMIKEDVSELTIRKEEKNPVIMIKGKQAQTDELYAIVYFLFEHNLQKTFQVGVGQTFLLQDIEYQVITIKKSVDNHLDEVVVKCTNPETENKEISLKPFNLEEARKPTPIRKASNPTEPGSNFQNMPVPPGQPAPYYRGPPGPPNR